MIVFFVSASCALLISFLCSLMEAALLSLSPSQMAQLAQKYPKVGNEWRTFKSHIDRPLAVILFLNTSAHTIGATIAGAQSETLWGQTATMIFSLVFTYLMLQFTEILPKALGVRYNVFVALYMTYPIRLCITLLHPVIWFIHLINRPFQGRRDVNETDPVDEIEALAGQARLTGDLTIHQEQIIQEAAHLDEEKVTEIMIPVESICFLSDEMNMADALVIAHNDPHTRFPVCEDGNKDRIVGYINFKELIYHMHVNPAAQQLKGVIRPVFLAEPDMNVSELLKVFVDRHEHMAIVRSQEGGHTLGLVTLEDVIEQFLGRELGDEFDRPPTMLHPLAGGTWMVGGGIPVARLSKRLQYVLPCADPENTDLSDFLIGQFGKEPQVNDMIRIGPYNVLIRRMRRGKVFEASVSLFDSAPLDRAS